MKRAKDRVSLIKDKIKKLRLKFERNLINKETLLRELEEIEELL